MLASPYSKAGALIICLPFLHRLHLNVSCVSQSVFSLNKNSCRSASIEKWRSVFSFSSTTAEERACLLACRWKIFSSIVPVEMNRYTKPSIPINTRSTKGIDTHILSSGRLATLEQELVDQPQDSNLKQSQCGKRSGERVLPTGVEENESIGANEIDTTPAGFTAQ